MPLKTKNEILRAAFFLVTNQPCSHFSPGFVTLAGRCASELSRCHLGGTFWLSTAKSEYHFVLLASRPSREIAYNIGLGSLLGAASSQQAVVEQREAKR